jgi:hypothetical protein
MELTTILPIIENNAVPIIVWVLVYFSLVKGIRQDLIEIKSKLDKQP